VLGDYHYIIGGMGTSGTGSLLRYDPLQDSWEQLAPLLQRREHTAAVVLNGKIYALAGRWQGLATLRRW